ncbi:hypothetical protein NUU61_005383 [Penicillium alfredii]|uniref:Uncharacterized protein n=1 Tax=Penicillium alfredii TaxID=1506179 RepID=A0A9W9F9D0_9EURO|nr:uncharacterized protein NUU61_005383 [Penicillium alfredii]KAJ5096027.1 hypothetical protein NUU61_005383 [Penicillium alfredii]
MVNLCQTMANLVKKFKRKRRMSSELHSRWGDVSISYPIHGSWNQWDQPSGFAANSSTEAPPINQDDIRRRYMPVDPTSRSTSGESGGLHSRGEATLEDSIQPSPPFPTGHFDESVRHRYGKNNKPRLKGLGISGTRRDPGSIPDAATESCDEDEERDTLGVQLSRRDDAIGDMPQYASRHDPELYADRESRSPPLSVTSRMRRCSLQSCSTELSTTGSRHTSYTAASSVSAPSVHPDTPRFAYNTMHSAHSEKRHPPRPKHREPSPGARQQMVPSYDELYG